MVDARLVCGSYNLRVLHTTQQRMLITMSMILIYEAHAENNELCSSN